MPSHELIPRVGKKVLRMLTGSDVAYCKFHSIWLLCITSPISPTRALETTAGAVACTDSKQASQRRVRSSITTGQLSPELPRPGF